MKRKLEIVCVALLAAGVAQAAVYTWTGSATDGDWTTVGNWDGGTAPTSLSGGDTITFAGANMPTANLATFSSGYDGVQGAYFDFQSGGAFNLDMSTASEGGYMNYSAATVLTVGDGTGGGTDNVVVNVSGLGYLLRHNTPGSVTDYRVNSDGLLTFDGNLNLYGDHAKFATLTLNGGEIVAAGSFNAEWNNALQSGNSYIDFIAEGGSLTAAYGGAFANIDAVEADANGLFVDTNGGGLEFADNGTSFTVTAIPEPATLGLVVAFSGGILFVRRLIQM